MEMFDYALWRANDENRCYDLVSVAGSYTIQGTIASVVAMVQYNRGSMSLMDWDVRLWFLNVCCSAAVFIYFSESKSDLIPQAPYRTNGVNRNVWYSDDLRVALPSLPFYILPLVRGWFGNRSAKDRFSRMLFQIINYAFASFVIAVLMSFAAWGSIWCIFASFVPALFDVHFILDAINGDDAPCKCEPSAAIEKQVGTTTSSLENASGSNVDGEANLSVTTI